LVAKINNNSVFVIKKSKIHGRGVYSKGILRKGVEIIEYVGKRKKWYPTFKKKNDGCVWLMHAGDGWIIDGFTKRNIARFINHSCNPNCQAVLIDKQVFIETLRVIKANQEITIDYNLSLGCEPTEEDCNRFRCDCGSSKCRGTLLELFTPTGF